MVYSRFVSCNTVVKTTFFKTNYLVSSTKKISTKPKAIPELDMDVYTDIKSNVKKARQHPGIMKTPCSSLPQWLSYAIDEATKDRSIKVLAREGESLKNFYYNRFPPIEKAELHTKTATLRSEVVAKLVDAPEDLSDEQREHMEKVVEGRVESMLYRSVYNWRSVEYTVHVSMLYLVAVAPQQYSTMLRVLKEIAVRDPAFQPETLFDFGSGVGTVGWAVQHYWMTSLSEIFCVDSSVHMNDLASFLSREADKNFKQVKGRFFRQFLPSSSRIRYDIVVSAYSLLELPSSEARLKTVFNLWKKTKNYLVLVEMGMPGGFQVLNEARDFILESAEAKDGAHIFAPCPHEERCPQASKESKSICYFKNQYIAYRPRNSVQTSRYSFVIIKKGERPADDPQWPRLVQPMLPRSGHCICRMCSADGSLKEIVFTPSKHGKTAYKCAKVSKWGDLLPIKIREEGADDIT